jgi:hypothetical protein
MRLELASSAGGREGECEGEDDSDGDECLKRGGAKAQLIAMRSRGGVQTP